MRICFLSFSTCFYSLSLSVSLSLSLSLSPSHSLDNSLPLPLILPSVFSSFLFTEYWRFPTSDDLFIRSARFPFFFSIIFVYLDEIIHRFFFWKENPPSISSFPFFDSNCFLGKVMPTLKIRTKWRLMNCCIKLEIII